MKKVKIYKETKIKHPLYVTVLDNGVTLLIFDGYAEGSDGKKYQSVIKEIKDGEYELVGWKLN